MKGWSEWYTAEDLWHDAHRSIDGVTFRDRMIDGATLYEEATGVAERIRQGHTDAGIGETLDSYPLFRLAGGWYGMDAGTSGYLLYNTDGRALNVGDIDSAENVGVATESGLDRVVDDRSSSPDWNVWLVRTYGPGVREPLTEARLTTDGLLARYPALVGTPYDGLAGTTNRAICPLDDGTMLFVARVACVYPGEGG